MTSNKTELEKAKNAYIKALDEYIKAQIACKEEYMKAEMAYANAIDKYLVSDYADKKV